MFCLSLLCIRLPDYFSNWKHLNTRWKRSLLLSESPHWDCVEAEWRKRTSVLQASVNAACFRWAMAVVQSDCVWETLSPPPPAIVSDVLSKHISVMLFTSRQDVEHLSSYLTCPTNLTNLQLLSVCVINTVPFMMWSGPDSCAKDGQWHKCFVQGFISLTP